MRDTLPCCCFLLLLVMPGAASPLSAARQSPLPIAIVHSGSDPVGRSFVDRLKEALTYSGRYALAASEADSELTLRISTIDPSTANPGSQSVAAWSLLVTKRNDAYLSGGIRSFGARSAGDSADALAVAIDKIASTHREAIPGSDAAKESARAWDVAVQRAAGRIRSEDSRTIYVQHMELQRSVFLLSGVLLPAGANLEELAASLAAEYNDLQDGSAAGARPSAPSLR